MIRVYVDIETTGLSARHGHGIVEVAAAAYMDEDWSCVSEFSSYSNPGVALLRSFAMNEPLVCGRTPRYILEHARPEADVAKSFRRFLHALGPCALHAYNRAFDASFLRRPPWSISSEMWGECVMLRVRRVIGMPKFPSLESAAVALGVVPESPRHSARADALTAAAVHKAVFLGRACR
jgi:DNA polymerase III epsilon subunit-like protein